MAALEGGIGAVATASGMAAFFLTVATLMDKGSHIVLLMQFMGEHIIYYRILYLGLELIRHLLINKY